MPLNYDQNYSFYMDIYTFGADKRRSLKLILFVTVYKC